MCARLHTVRKVLADFGVYDVHMTLYCKAPCDEKFSQKEGHSRKFRHKELGNKSIASSVKFLTVYIQLYFLRTMCNCITFAIDITYITIVIGTHSPGSGSALWEATGIRIQQVKERTEI